jgi:hypothetical protein
LALGSDKITPSSRFAASLLFLRDFSVLTFNKLEGQGVLAPACSNQQAKYYQHKQCALFPG